MTNPGSFGLSEIGGKPARRHGDETARRGRSRSPAEAARVPAVASARAHVEAWSNHKWDAARNAVGTDGHITASTTLPIMAPVDISGADDYMADENERAIRGG